jgi:hypothetical protein
MATSIGFDRISYFGERLSENIARTPEGFLVCRNAIIGRTGFQTYKAAELSDTDRSGEIARLYGPTDDVQVWRDESEVFSPATIASFEGKPFTLTHPRSLLDPGNVGDHAQGHIQNVRRGEQLEDGNLGLIADIFVTGDRAIRAIEDGERELSCGYTYQLVREGKRWDQRNIEGNHIALVERGRAGDVARINDEAPRFSIGVDARQVAANRVAEQDALYAHAGQRMRLAARDKADLEEKRQFTGTAGEKKVEGSESWERHLPDAKELIHAWYHGFATGATDLVGRSGKDSKQYLHARLRNFVMGYRPGTTAEQVDQTILRDLVKQLRTAPKAETSPRTMGGL